MGFSIIPTLGSYNKIEYNPNFKTSYGVTQLVQLICIGKLKVVARSSTESEYIALAHTVAEVTWLQGLLKELQVPNFSCPVICCDNIGATCIVANPVAHALTKHIEVDVHFVRDKVLQKELDIWYVPTEDQIAEEKS
ncbi:Retrovirus-related Pol polyprotein from transposon RE1 [Vitis vinifera]|uniref:Retrovirus-related Pol polyprotein from transposon RE1 n=1 Tax=Vitis vinifera TaxID=29760 RepID=A0A438CC27_VITVI|nr:Retrovirus-related Pol polyprotein from transposon RE1 [Vitis vinifera]